MTRRALVILLHLAAGISLAICLATAVAWARGGWDQKRFYAIAGNWSYSSAGDANNGRIFITIDHDWPVALVGPPSGTTGPAVDAWLNRPFHFQIESGKFNLHYWVDLEWRLGHANWIMAGRRLDVDAPFSGAIILLLILPTLVWFFLPIRRRGIRSIKRKAESRIENALIMADLPCAHCGYNLRTQSSKGQCPECGSLVSDSLALNVDLEKSPPAWLRRLAAGALLLFLARVMLGTTLAAVFKRNGEFVMEYVPAVCFASATIVLYGLGIFLMTVPQYPHIRLSERKSAMRLRKLAAASLICLAAGIGYQTMETATAPRPFGLMGSASVEWYWPSLILLLIGWVLYCCCIVVEFQFLSQLAERIGDRIMARMCIWAGAGAAASSVVLLFGAQRVVAYWSLGIFREVLVAWFLTLLWTGLMNLDFAIRLGKIGSLSKARKARESGAL